MVIRYVKLYFRYGLLDAHYSNFNKTDYSKLCMSLSEGATTHGDPLCKALFNAAGKALASHVKALLPHAHPVSTIYRVG